MYVKTTIIYRGQVTVFIPMRANAVRAWDVLFAGRQSEKASAWLRHLKMGVSSVLCGTSRAAAGLVAKYFRRWVVTGDCVQEILAMDEPEARDALYRFRWWDADDGFECARCGSKQSPYELFKQKKVRCRACGKEKRLTSGTIFHGTKLSIRQCLLFVALMWDKNEDVSSAEIMKTCSVSSRTADLLRKKFKDGNLYWGRSEAWTGYYQRRSSQ